MNDATNNHPLSDEQISLISQPTPSEHVEFGPGRGGMLLAYVKISYAIQMLNRIFGYNWSVEHGDPIILEASDEVLVPTRLVVRLPHDGGEIEVVKTQYGRDDIARNRQGQIVSQGDAIKSAASDGLKKCASLWGMFADVYSGEATIEAGRQQDATEDVPPTITRPSVPPMPDVPMPETAEAGMARLLEVAEEHFGIEPSRARDILRQSRFRPSQLPGQFTVMLETLREAAVTERVA